MRGLRGFTLIEMLVVLGIIAVLFAILFPVFSRARASARSAACVSQLSQLYKAAKMYSDDHDRTLVPARTQARSTGTQGITWCVLLEPYMKGDQILICPEDDQPRATASSICKPHSYGINYLLSYNSAWGAYPFVLNMSSINRVSDIVQFFDMDTRQDAMGASYQSHRVSRVAARHNERANFAFLDGHVKNLPVQSVDNVRSWNPFAP